MAKSAKDIVAATATHPGSVLKCELQERGIKQKDFAAVIGMTASNLSELVNGKRHVSQSIAVRLEEALGIPFQTWMGLQNQYFYVVGRHGKSVPAKNSAATNKSIKNDIIPTTSQEKKQQVFRLPVNLLDRLKELARQDRRSLNNYVECLLTDAICSTNARVS